MPGRYTVPPLICSSTSPSVKHNVVNPFLKFGGAFLKFGGAFLKFGGAFLKFGGAFLKFGGAFLKFGGAFLKFGGVCLKFGGVFLKFGGASVIPDLTCLWCSYFCFSLFSVFHYS